MKRKKAVVDLDSIVADFFGDHSPNGLWPVHFQRTGEQVRTEQILTWNMKKHVEKGDELIAAFYEPGFFRNLDPLPGSQAGVETLLRDFDIMIASAPCTPHSAAEKIEWCAKHLAFLDQKNVWIGHNKAELHADLLIDDGPHNAKAYREAHPHAFIVSPAYPYNNVPEYDLRAGSYLTPFDTWAEMLGAIHRKFGIGPAQE